ncbi:MAG: glycoside hydrolase family 3 C-terminal domain-containing protein [Bacteroidales bacterium]|nr:glycoside hydrolase family 3 C-terminal domain-containing protein [Bacteroidales bacterium]
MAAGVILSHSEKDESWGLYATFAAKMAIAIVSLVATAVSLSARAVDTTQVRMLVSQLTLEEKAALMRFESPAIPRLGIPEYNWWNEALHGVARNGDATMFPMPIGMAASFDDELLLEVFNVVSDEAVEKNWEGEREKTLDPSVSLLYKGLSFWTPNINIFRDPRWGRGMETYGEDPYLTGVMGCAVVRGLQGEDCGKVHACAKHYAVHSGPEYSRHHFDAEVSERDLRETYLPAFKDLVTKADVQEVMYAYNSFRGEPCGASKYLLQDILRGEWGYRGIILSDCGAVQDFYNDGGHGFSADRAEASAVAIKTGTQLECGWAFPGIIEAVKRGILDESLLDAAVEKLIYERMRLEENARNNRKIFSVVSCKKHSLLSLEMARESIVLLKNDGVLPLSSRHKVALVGPNADDVKMLWGNYCGTPRHTVTLLEAVQARIPNLKYVEGCPLVIGDVDIDGLLRQLEGYDIVVFAGGISPSLEGEEMPVQIPGFLGGDRTSIELPAVQRKTIDALVKAGKKVILVNFSGSAIALEPESRICSAILQAWYPGQEGGTAVADVLLGDFNPCGKLPVTFYRNDSQLPDYEDYNMAGHTYRFMKEEPLYPFGYGLSYTTFEIGKPRIRKEKELVVRVKNTGNRKGTEVVQLYVRKEGDPAGPAKTLRGFKRVTIPAHRSRRVVLPMDDDTFLWWSDSAQNMIPGSGRFAIMIGSSSSDRDLQEIIIDK